MFAKLLVNFQNMYFTAAFCCYLGAKILLVKLPKSTNSRYKIRETKTTQYVHCT